jgi:hypothetical protein
MEPESTVWTPERILRDYFVWNKIEHRCFLTMAPKGRRAGRPESRCRTVGAGVVAKIL